jgi:hypothetical protein
MLRYPQELKNFSIKIEGEKEGDVCRINVL